MKLPKWLRGYNLQKEITDLEQNMKIEESNKQFVTAAAATLNMARDVSAGLKDKINDFSKEIEATSAIISDSLFLLDNRGRIVTMNSAASDTFEYDIDELRHKPIDTLFQNNKGLNLSFTDLQEYSNKTYDIKSNVENKCYGVDKNQTRFCVEIKIKTFKTSASNQNRYVLLVKDITDRINAEELLLNLVNRQRATISALPDNLIIVDEHLNIHFIVDSCTNAIISKSDTGKNLNNLIPLDALGQIYKTVVSVKQSNHVQSCHIEINRGTERKYFEARISNCGNNFLILLRDETEKTIAQLNLKQSEEHFRLFGEASSEAMIIHSEHQILDWNKRLETMTGLNPVEIKLMNALDIFHPYEREKISCELTDSPRSFMSLLLTRDDGFLDIAVNDQPILWRGELARIKIIRDLTNIKDIDNILQLSRQRYQSLTESTFDIVVSYDPNYRITFQNSTFESYFGHTTNVSMRDIIDTRDHQRMDDHISKLSSNNQIGRILYRVKFNNETRWLDWIDRAIFDSENKIIEYNGVGRDVTDYIRRIKDI